MLRRPQNFAKSTVEISQEFVALSEYMNFKREIFLENSGFLLCESVDGSDMQAERLYCIFNHTDTKTIVFFYEYGLEYDLAVNNSST